MTYYREIAIITLLASLCFATWQCDRNKNRLTTIDSDKVRQSQISSVQADRMAVKYREKTQYPEIERSLAEINSQRKKLKENAPKNAPTRREIENDTDKKTEGDIYALARLFVLAGYSCSVR